MDQFKKVANLLREKWKNFLKVQWHNLPSDNYFGTVDVSFNLAGILFTPTKRWQRVCWRVYQWFPAYHFLIMTVDCVEHLYDRTNFFWTVWPLIKIIAMTMAYVRVVVFRRNYDSIVQSRNFINGKQTSSGDADYDYGMRKQFFRRLQMISFALHGAIVLTGLLAAFFISPEDKLFGLPQSMLGMNHWKVEAVYYLFITTLFFIWVNRNCAAPVLASALLDGYETELKIFGHGIEQICNHVQLTQPIISDNPKQLTPGGDNEAQRAAAAAQERLVLDEFWIDLKQRVRVSVEQHVQLLENLQQFQSCVEELFLVVYYTALIMFGALIYAPVTEGISVGTSVGLTGLTFYFAECFWWCNLVESLRDANKTNEENIMDLMATIPYHKEHHSDYVQIRTTLMIVKMNIRNSAQFECYQIVSISNELFCELLNTAYTVLTFLLEMNK